MTTRVPLRSAASKDTRLEQPLHDGVQPSCADILGLLVDLEGHLRQALHARVLEGELEPFGRHERGVLAAERGIRLGQDPHEILDHQRLELDPDGKPSLQLGNQVRGLGHVKGAGGDEEHMIGLDRTVLGVDGTALDQRQEVPLHALARHIGARGLLAARDLVDLVDEHDAVLLGVLDGADLELLLVHHLGRFLIQEQLQRFLDLELARTGLAAAQILEHALQLLRHFFHAGRRHDLDAHRHRAYFDLDLPLIQLMLAQHLAKTLPGVVVARCPVPHEPGLGAR